MLRAPKLTVCVQRFDAAGFARDLEATARELVAVGLEVRTEHLGEHGALLVCYEPRARRRPRGLVAAREALRRGARTLDRLEVEPGYGFGEDVRVACAADAAAAALRGVREADLGAVLGELHRARRAFTRAGRTVHLRLVERLVERLATRKRRLPA